jgi:mannose-1-phosphate guanylyltransferase
MKAFLLAAGHGTRLRPLTDTMPKCLVPIRGVPLLKIWLDLCRSHEIDEVLINVHAHADAVRAFVSGTHTGVTVTVSEEKVLLGSAGTLVANRAWLQSDSSFWIFYSDVLTAARLDPLLSIHREYPDHLASLGVYQVPDPRRCGIVTLDERGIVRGFVEKSENPPGCLADIGFHVLPQLVGRMGAVPINEFLLDIGTMDNYRKAQEVWPAPQIVSN